LKIIWPSSLSTQSLSLAEFTIPALRAGMVNSAPKLFALTHY
jgi:hypothetical protein